MKKTVFVVDDEITITKILSTILRKNFDINIVVANSFDEAKALLSAQRADLCFFDINLGDGSGYDLISRVKTEQNKNSFVVMMSAYAKDIETDEALRRGADHFMAKPFERDKLIDLVKAYID